MFVEKLLSIASEAIGDSIAIAEDGKGVGPRYRELIEMLARKNGFYAFESALHVFPFGDGIASASDMSVQAWNAENLWRNEYEGITEGLIFFGEDAFGEQFAIRGGDVVTFDPESGEINRVAGSLEEWAASIFWRSIHD